MKKCLLLITYVAMLISIESAVAQTESHQLTDQSQSTPSGKRELDVSGKENRF